MIAYNMIGTSDQILQKVISLSLTYEVTLFTDNGNIRKKKKVRESINNTNKKYN